jgi:hypothetical protein
MAKRESASAAFAGAAWHEAEMSWLGLALVFGSGVVTGVALDLFALCALGAPLFAAVLAISAPQAG